MPETRGFDGYTARYERLVDESDKRKPNRKAKLCFEPVEQSVIRRCLFDWRNEQVQAEKETAVEVIGELLEKVL